MKFDLEQSTIQLTKGNLISLPDAEGSTVAVLWGSVWLTQDGDSRDHEVNAGESFTIRGDGLVLISAFENAALTILQPCEGIAIAPNPGENTSLVSSNHKLNENGVRYLSSDELQHYQRTARELRAGYIASLFTSLGRAVSRGLSKLGDRIVAWWLDDPRGSWTPSGRRLHL